jgi:hypothetical protein
MDGHPVASPVYLGVNSPHCDDGGLFGNRHFGLKYDEVSGEEVQLSAPRVLYDTIVREGIEAVLWTWYPETHGATAPPYHTKARRMAEQLSERLSPEFALPLKQSLCLKTDNVLQQIVEARLKNHCGFGERRLCLLGRGGYTSIGKNWGHMWREDLPDGCRAEGQECHDFIDLMLRKSRDWCFLLMEDRNFGDSLKHRSANTYSYSDVFGEPETAIAPFAQIMKCLTKLAGLCVGVPAGPYHVAAQAVNLPTIGVWLEHLPSWYDEPREGLIHVIGSGPAAQFTDTARPGSFLKWGGLTYSANILNSRIIPGAAVMDAAESLLGAGDWAPPRVVNAP